jgi:hypothetical protein
MEKDQHKKRLEKARELLRVGQKVVLINDGGHRHLAGGIAAFDAHHTALAAHSDAFRQRDLGWQGQREVNRGAGLDGGIDVEADSARADVARLRLVLLLILAIADAYGQAKREATRGPLITILVLVLLVLLRLGHRTAPKARFQSFKNLPQIACKHGNWRRACQVEARFQSFKVSEFQGLLVESHNFCFFIETLKP